MSRKILFFDLNVMGLARYPLQIANQINASIDDNKFYFLYEEDPSEKLRDFTQSSPNNSTIVKVKNNSQKSIQNLLLELSPDVLIVMAQRIPDSALVAIANKLGIQTIMLQHGLYIPFMKKNKSIFIYRIYKTFRYFQYCLALAKAINHSKIKVCWIYFNIFIKGRKITEYDLPLKKINTEKVLVYGDYWKKYHQVEFGYSTDDQITVGYPDLDQLKEIKKDSQEDAVCYICQTLVEDDRLPRATMESFIKLLCENIGNRKLYIKLHPRSDKTLYNPLKGKKNVIFLDKVFPYCNKYIAHYSSLIAMAMNLSNYIFLWKFDNHNEYPTYLTNNAYKTSGNEKDLKGFLNIDCNIEVGGYIDKYFFYDGVSPIKKIIRNIL